MAAVAPNWPASMLAATRHVSEEARECLASLRSGPPQIARGPLAQELQQLRLDMRRGWLRDLDEHQDECNDNADDNALLDGSFARPFLRVIVDPRAAGPHTLVALRALFRLFHRKSLVRADKHSAPSAFQVALDPLVRGLLACKFEQTDVGADEAVEMAIADLIALLVSLDCAAAARHQNDKHDDDDNYTTIRPHTLMDAFNTVFVTRNTFVHSPALCYHFEEVLTHIITAVFQAASTLKTHAQDSHPILISSLHLLEFLVNQLLHTPLDVRGIHSYNYRRKHLATTKELKGKGLAEAHAMHDETCSLCLRLVKVSLRVGWDGILHQNKLFQHKKIHKIIQDELCLSLLTLGQGIWTGAAADTTTRTLISSAISPQLLTEVCTTISLLWQNTILRQQLTSQFEAIFTGFYQRSLALLRRLPIPDDNDSFYSNQHLDTLLEIILESLVDIFTLDTNPMDAGKQTPSTLEALFLKYDCNIHRSDVASGIILELCRCCGGTLNEEGEFLLPETLYPLYNPENIMVAGTPPLDPRFGGEQDTLPTLLDFHVRPVPAPLQELCVQALLGSLNTLFLPVSMEEPYNTTKDDTIDYHHTDETQTTFLQNQDQHPLRRAKRHKQIMRHAAQLFNKKSSSGIQYLIDEKLVPSPVTPESVASFLRNGIILGLDKRAVGEYLGEIGKAPMEKNNGQLPLIYEWDKFHKETLQAYCASFHFDGLTLLDSLRMFLAAFRLPGEAQQIDRILQAFADTCSRKCDESIHGSLQLFPEEEKKASDTAYLLSFSIIMLNTDLHNPNIRRDRKMSLDAFVLNNMEYGRDITGGKQLNRDYLTRIYESIRDEQIRTEGEGADGIMTYDRWKDVLRARTTNEMNTFPEKVHVVKDIILEMFLTPLISTVAGIWGVSYEGPSSDESYMLAPARDISIASPQAARWGIDLSSAVLDGARIMSRLDIFRMFFVQIALFTGLLDNGGVAENHENVTLSLLGSIERQGAIVCLMRKSYEYRDILGIDEWKCLWGIIFDLRDRALLSTRGVVESDTDFLQLNARREWFAQLLKEHKAYVMGEQHDHERASGSFFSSLFSSSKKSDSVGLSNISSPMKSMSGKSLDRVLQVAGTNVLIWDDKFFESEDPDDVHENFFASVKNSIGVTFESQLMAETMIFSSSGVPLTFTGLETYDDRTVASSASLKRVRKRMDSAFQIFSFLIETRFMDVNSLTSFLQALVQIIEEGSLAIDSMSSSVTECQSPCHAQISIIPPLAISPASEALAEVIVCEVALKNRDRLVFIWEKVLRRHYRDRLKRAVMLLAECSRSNLVYIRPGLEKCITGILRLCGHGLGRGDLADDMIDTLGILFRSNGHFSTFSSTLALDKHLGEGMWRLCKELDSLRLLGNRGWESLLSLIEYCASHGEYVPVRVGSADIPSVCEDDPCLKSYRSVSLILHSTELREVLPFRLVRCIRALIIGGERQNYPELSLAALDLLLIMNSRMKERISMIEDGNVGHGKIWIDSWLSLIHITSEAAESKYPNIRKKAVVMLLSFMMDPSCDYISSKDILGLLTSLCVPIGGQRITDLVRSSSSKRSDDEFDDLYLSSRLVFEPFLRHLPKITVTEPHPNILTLWVMILAVIGQLVGKDVSSSGAAQSFLTRAQEIAEEYLRSSMNLMMSLGVLRTRIQGDKVTDDQVLSVSVMSGSDGGINDMTWTAIDNMPYFRGLSFDAT